ncbi:MAG: Asp-tRNA(Asn)/Glu-tRNA(Gln) amidotransferase GatCAB subunit B, partial [Nitrospinota bacterium]|nr:Asp-tRNA(Asn)/Glu-tRNA(Gln) amidotransferase GatCAB subunit B [Nitrospinota bacterium]
IAAHPEEVEQYQSGKTKLLGFFMGRVMKSTGGKANPQTIQGILKRKLSV